MRHHFDQSDIKLLNYPQNLGLVMTNRKCGLIEDTFFWGAGWMIVSCADVADTCTKNPLIPLSHGIALHTTLTPQHSHSRMNEKKKGFDFAKFAP